MRPRTGHLARPARHPGAGAIIKVSSGALSIAGPPGLAAYAVKAALQTYTSAFREWEANDPDSVATVLTNIPLGRPGVPEHDIGRAVVFLVVPDPEFITGI